MNKKSYVIPDNEEVIFLLSGGCYHKFKYMYNKSTGNFYVQSVCGTLDSPNWNTHRQSLDHWFVQKLRPCRRCYR